MTAFIAASILVLFGVILPPNGAAELLVGPTSPLLPDVVVGMWVLKAMLVVHAGLLLAASRIRSSDGHDGPLLSTPLEGGAELITARTAWLIVVALSATALVLRLVDLGAGLWYDEVRAMVEYGGLTAGEIVATYDSQNNHVLYTLLARGSMALFGETGWALRLPAALFGVASVPALYWFGSMLVTRLEALLAAALLVFSYHHVWFSQNARGYSALLFFTLLASGLFLLMLRRRRFEGWTVPVLYGMCMALASYVNVIAVLVATAHGMIWLALLPWRDRGKAAWAPAGALVVAATISLLLYAPVLPQLLRVLFAPTMAGLQTEWESGLWFIAELTRGLARGLPGGWLTLAAGAGIGAVGLASYARKSLTVLGLLILPGILMTVLLVVMDRNLWPRLFFFSAGFAVLIGVRGLVRITAAGPKRWRSSIVTAVAIVAVLGAAVTVPQAWGPKQDFTGARAFIGEVVHPGDAVVVVDMSRIPFNSWLDANWATVSSEAELIEVEKRHRRTWVLYIFPTRLRAVQPEILDRLERQYTTAAEFPGTLGDGAVIVKVRG